MQFRHLHYQKMQNQQQWMKFKHLYCQKKEIICKWNPGISIVRKSTISHENQDGNCFQMPSKHLHCENIQHQPQKFFSSQFQASLLSENATLVTEIISAENSEYIQEEWWWDWCTCDATSGIMLDSVMKCGKWQEEWWWDSPIPSHSHRSH